MTYLAVCLPVSLWWSAEALVDWRIWASVPVGTVSYVHLSVLRDTKRISIGYFGTEMLNQQSRA